MTKEILCTKCYELIDIIDISDKLDCYTDYKKEQLRRRIIELIHKVPYEKLSSEEKSISIYLGTLLLAIDMSYKSVDYTLFPQKKFNYYYTGGDIIFQKYSETDIVIGWYTRNKILKEATLDDQSEETINTLHQLLITE